jgi:hypothetical protein
MLRDGFPINVLNQIKAVPEVCGIYCATANDVDVLVAASDRGRAIIGVIDGSPPAGIENRRGRHRAAPSPARHWLQALIAVAPVAEHQGRAVRVQHAVQADRPEQPPGEAAVPPAATTSRSAPCAACGNTSAAFPSVTTGRTRTSGSMVLNPASAANRPRRPRSSAPALDKDHQPPFP